MCSSICILHVLAAEFSVLLRCAQQRAKDELLNSRQWCQTVLSLDEMLILVIDVGSLFFLRTL